MRAAAVVAAFVLGLAAVAAAEAPTYPDVGPGDRIVFPADEGSHPTFRTEWWYVTGWLKRRDGSPLGFQVTFFRTKPGVDPKNPSAFAAHELVIGHAALSDPKRPRARHAERIARAGFGLAGAATDRTHVTLGDWSIESAPDGISTHVVGEDFELDLRLGRPLPPMPNGQGGYSQKGPAAHSASLYYSIPGLTVRGRIVEGGKPVEVTGEAWLDHEWSSAYLDPQSVGWDWLGLNLDGGGALMAFRIRDASGEARWAGGSLRSPDGAVRMLAPAEIAFRAGRHWRSPHTGIDWPIEGTVRAGPLELTLVPLMDDQESDSRATTGAVYWEGAVSAKAKDGSAGRGYLELTGYGAPLVLR